MKDPSRLYRWILLAASLVTIGYLISAAVRENYLEGWQETQRTYRNILRTKASDGRGQELLRNFRIELRQVSLPQLGTVDRCITCHVGIDDPRMTDVPQPFRVHPGAILNSHPIDRFGCTICHHGQGAATNFRDAKAEDVFWDYPLLPANLTQSSCLTCHDASHLPGQQVALLVQGMTLFEQKSCESCHKLGGRGGILGLALDNEGSKTRHELTMTNLSPPHTAWRWHESHFRDPAAVVVGSQMRNPTVTDGEALALTVYMLALRRHDVPESYLAPDKIEQKYAALHPQPLTGERAYRKYCFACHAEGDFGRWDKTFRRFIPAIRGSSLLATASSEYLEMNIAKGRPGTQMPGWSAHAGGLQPAEISALRNYLKSEISPVQPPTGANSITRGDGARGAPLFLQNCAGCHGPAGRGGVAPEIGNPTFQEAATDDFIVTTIRNGRMGAAMPAFQRPSAAGLSDAEIGDLLGFIRNLNLRSSSTKVGSASARPDSGTR
jgi:mono/diheme cytochrome c family protein